MNIQRTAPSFWPETFAIEGSALPLVIKRSLMVTLLSLAVTAIHKNQGLPDLGVEVTPFELAGGALGVLLVLRTNAGYERWWEGRRLWGGIVNQSRNLAIAALGYGPDDPDWRDRIVRRTAAFGHASRLSLRGEKPLPELETLLGPDDAARVAAAVHKPSEVARLIADSLREARERLGMDGFSLMRIDQERSSLIDHIGGCERILKTPLPRAYRIEIRRFLVVFLASLPFGLVDTLGWLTPFVTFLAALPLLSIDKIGTELQYPFATSSLNHLPLDDICATIEHDLLGMLDPVADVSPRS